MTPMFDAVTEEIVVQVRRRLARRPGGTEGGEIGTAALPGIFAGCREEAARAIGRATDVRAATRWRSVHEALLIFEEFIAAPGRNNP